MKESYLELWHNKSNSWIEKKEINTTKMDLVQVKAAYSLVSLGTEKLLLEEMISEDSASQMRVPYSQGDYNKSFTYGYSLVGQIIKGSANLKNKYVHLLHPHQQIAFVNDNDVFEIPKGVSPKVATLASNMETAVNAVWDAELSIGDNVVIVGYGIVGALIALIARNIPGVLVTVVEANESRFQKARKHGYEVTKNLAHYSSFDVAINSSANESGLQLAIDKTISEGRIIEVSWYGKRKVNLSLGDSFHYGRKKIISSQVSQLPKNKQLNWTYKKRKELVFGLLRKFNPEFLLDGEIGFTDCPNFYNLLRKGQNQNLGIVINYSK